MRKHLFVTLLLACGMPLTGSFAAYAEPVPQSQSQGMVTITGSVLDENNEPVIGASVVQKGAQKNAVATNFDGNFTIRVPRGATLRVSFVGYKPVEMAASESMTVYLQPTTEMLDQVVAIGYGSQKRANLTGSVATVDVEKAMDNRPTSDVAKALQGAVPGLTITTSSGDISANPQISIRGLGTLSNGHTSNPLIVVDGVPVDDMSFLNPDDIADISVLKDASSSAIYGARAAFGVILITTKTASTQDRVSISYTNNFSWGSATILPTPNSTVRQLEIAMDDTNPGADKEIFGMYYDELLPFAQAWAAQHSKPYDSYVELQPYQSPENVGDYYVFPANTISPLTGNLLQTNRFMSYADWDVKKTYFAAAPGQKHNVSLEGTSGKTHYRLSFGYDGKQGLNRYNPDKMNRYMANATIDTQVFSWLKAGARFNFSDREYTSPNLQRNSYQYLWRFPSFFEMPGYVYDEDGVAKSFRNDMTIRMNSPMDKTVTTETRMQGWMNAEIIKGLNLQADFTYILRQQDSDATQVPYTAWNNWTPGSNSLGSWTPYTQTTSSAAQSHYRDATWVANVFATYAKTIAEDHNLKIMAGWSADHNEYKYFYAKRNGLVDYNLPNIDLTNGENYTTSGSHTHNATTGFFGRINYDYKGIYLLEANGRYDGSSRFPANDQWAFFPSVSAGYRFSEEAYFEPLKSWWSNGKLRAGYGHIGNQAVGTNRFLSTVSAVSAGNVHWLNGNQKISEYSMPTLVSSTLTWERIVTSGFGLDLGFFDNEFNVGFDWFQRDTKDMLCPGAELPGVLGASAPYGNNGELRTRGWELQLNWNHSFGDAQVYATFNIGDARTKITKWSQKNLIYSYLPSNANYTEGAYFGDIWGFETDRYFTMDEAIFVPGEKEGDKGYYILDTSKVPDQSALEQGSFHYGPGDVKFKDLNGDGEINGGIPGRIELNGQIFDPGQPGYDEAKLNPDHKTLSVGSVKNHGDLKVIGNATPRYEYSFRIGGSWKGFDLDLFFQGVGKRNMWATGSTVTPMVQSALGTFTNQQSYNKVSYFDDGQIDPANTFISQDNTYPRPYAAFDGNGRINNIGQGRYNFYPQSRYLMSLAYLRLKNITFGYTLPVAITQKALIQKARVYFSAENLFFLHNGAGKYQLDPEQTLSVGSSVVGYNSGQGMYGRTVPQQRVLSFGIQVTL